MRGGSAKDKRVHRIVLSLTGSYDVQSFNPDGSVALDLLGRCSADVDVRPGMAALRLLATFESEATSFRTACSLDVVSS